MPPGQESSCPEIKPLIASQKDDINRHLSTIDISQSKITSHGRFKGYNHNHDGIPSIITSIQNDVKWILHTSDEYDGSLPDMSADEAKNFVVSKGEIGRCFKDRFRVREQSSIVLGEYSCEHDARCPIHVKLVRFQELNRIALYKRGDHNLRFHNLPSKDGKGLPLDARKMVAARPQDSSESLYSEMDTSGYLKHINKDRYAVVKMINTKKAEMSRSSNEKGKSANAKVFIERIEELAVPLDHLLSNLDAVVAEREEKVRKSRDYLWRVIVLCHDIDDETGDFNKIIWTTLKIAKLRVGLSQSSRGTGLVQLESDFTDNLFKPNLKRAIPQRKVGTVGVSDIMKCFHDLVDGIFNSSESAEVSKELFRHAKDIVEGFDAKVGRMLKDGGSGLSAASKDYAWLERTCFAHAARFPGTRGGGYRGTMGSLIRYLATNLELPLKVISAIMSHWMTITTLPTVPHYQVAREIFWETWSDVINDHVMKQYVHEYPEVGAAASHPGQSGSTNGLERRWGHWQTDSTDLSNSGEYKHEALVLNIMRAAGKRDERFSRNNVEFRHSEPIHRHSTWQAIVEESTINVPRDDVLATVYYALTDGRILTHSEAVGNAKALGGVVMYRPSAAMHNRMMTEAAKTVMARGGAGSAGHSEIRSAQLQGSSGPELPLKKTNYAVRREYLKLWASCIRDVGFRRKDGEDLLSYVTRNGQRLATPESLKSDPTQTVDGNVVAEDASEIGNIHNDVEKAIVRNINWQLRDDEKGGASTQSAATKEKDSLNECLNDRTPNKAKLSRKEKTKAMLENPSRKKMCKTPLGEYRMSFITHNGISGCICSDFCRDCECIDTARLRVIEKKLGCPKEIKNPTQSNFIPDVLDRLVPLHKAEYFSDVEENKAALALFPQIDPGYNMMAPIDGIKVPGTRPSTFGIDLLIKGGKMMVTSVSCPMADVQVGDEVTKINGASIVDAATKLCCVDEAAAKSMMATGASWRDTGKGFATISVRRHIRCGSRTGTAHGRELYDARLRNNEDQSALPVMPSTALTAETAPIAEDASTAGAERTEATSVGIDDPGSSMATDANAREAQSTITERSAARSASTPTVSTTLIGEESGDARRVSASSPMAPRAADDEARSTPSVDAESESGTGGISESEPAASTTTPSEFAVVESSGIMPEEHETAASAPKSRKRKHHDISQNQVTRSGRQSKCSDVYRQ